MCTGRVDLSFILRAFLNGKDGVIIGGCWPGECHYVTEGNYLTLSMTHILKRLLKWIGIHPGRVRLEYISASEGSRYAEVMNDFAMKTKALGPLGEGEGLDPEVLRLRLETARHLVPYIKLVERERIRVRFKTVEAYEDFFAGEAFERLFQDLVADKLALCQIMALLREKPRSVSELADMLGLCASDISRLIRLSARQGLERFDERRNLIAAAFNMDPAETGEGKTDGVRPAALDNAAIDAIIGRHKGKPGDLIHALVEIQSENRWLPKEILDKISRELEVPFSRVMQIASFYKTFSLTPKGRHEIHVCSGTACHLRGSAPVMDVARKAMGLDFGQVDADGAVSLETGSCLGSCAIGPEIILDGRHHGRITPEKTQDVLQPIA